MPAIEAELQALKDNLLDMLNLVTSQLIKCKQTIESGEIAKAEAVLDDENKVNIQELAIDRDCENILALYTPVAIDLRLVLATLKITNDLERIGDNAKSLAKFLIRHNESPYDKWIRKFSIVEMLDVIINMLKDMGEALRREDTRLAMRSAKKDEVVNEYNRKALRVAAELVAEKPAHAAELLTLFSLTRDLERAGDLTKNIAEELVFHIDAKVLKHQKKKD